jgi:hypothetical protein
LGLKIKKQRKKKKKFKKKKKLMLFFLKRKIDSAWESDFLQRKAYYLQI